MRERPKPVTKEQQEDLDKNPPKVEQRLQSESRSNVIKLVGLSEAELGSLKKIGDINKFNVNGHLMFLFVFQGQMVESGVGRDGKSPYLKVGGVNVLGGFDVGVDMQSDRQRRDILRAQEIYTTIQVYEHILEDQSKSVQDAQRAIKKSPALSEEKAQEDKMIAAKIREEKEKVGKSFLDMMSKLSGQSPLG